MAAAAASVPLTAASDPVVSDEPKVNASNKTTATDDTPVAASTSGNEVLPVTTSSEHDGSSSSSSDSDSDSDSDSEDEKSEVKTETKTSPKPLTESTVKEDVKVRGVLSEFKTESKKGEKQLSPKMKCSPAFAAEDVQEASVNEQVPGASCEEMKPAQEICAATEDTSEVTSSKVSAESTVKLAPQVTEDAGSLAATDAHMSSATAEKPPAVVTSQSIAAEDPTEALEAAAEVSAPVEELLDGAPVIAETTGGRLQTEAPVEPSDGTHYTTLIPKPLLLRFYFVDLYAPADDHPFLSPSKQSCHLLY